MTFRNAKTTTSIIALAILTVTMSMPNAFAHTTPVSDYYWQTNPETCYLENELDDIDFEGSRSASNYSDIEDELEDSRSTYNAEMGTITIRGEDGNSCSDNRRIEVGARDFGQWWTFGVERTWYLRSSDEITHSQIDLNTNQFVGFDSESSSCWNLDVDLEWIYNHELGHGIGMKHHSHLAANDSIMRSNCGSGWAGFNSADRAGIDIHYP